MGGLVKQIPRWNDGKNGKCNCKCEGKCKSGGQSAEI